MKSFFNLLKFISTLLLLGLGNSYAANAQIELDKMDDLRGGIVGIRQASLDSLHQSLIYLIEIRNTIEQAPLNEEDRKGFLYYFLGEGSPQMVNYYKNNPNTKVEAGDLGDEKFARLEALKFKQSWPKYILNTLAQYGQLEKEYPHNLTGSNYFYGLFSFFEFKNGDHIVVSGDLKKESLFALMLGLYLENANIYINKNSSYDLTRFFKNRLQNLTAEGTMYFNMDKRAEDNNLVRKDKFLLIDLFQRKDRKQLLSFAAKTLLPDGELGIIETSKNNLSNFIKYDLLLSKSKIKRLARRAGFKLIEIENLKVLQLYRFRKI